MYINKYFTRVILILLCLTLFASLGLAKEVRLSQAVLIGGGIGLAVVALGGNSNIGSLLAGAVIGGFIGWLVE